MATTEPRVIVVGAGIVGCAAALSLARRGARVTVLERTRFGERAASRRAAGILGAQLESHDTMAMAELCEASRDRHHAWLPQLEELSGVDVGYVPSGALQLAFDEAGRKRLAEMVSEQSERGLRAELLGSRAVREREPAISAAVVGGAYFPDDGRLDPPLLLEAAYRAAERAGASFRTEVGVKRLLRNGHPGPGAAALRVTGVELDDGGMLSCDEVVIAAGSWSALVGDMVVMRDDVVVPARGQMLELTAQAPLFRCVLEGPGAYLSPRDDGRVLVGSTVERVGFEEAVTAGAMRDLLSGALQIAPDLAHARVSDSWCGFRAATPDDLPILGRAGLGLVLATGHFRNGVLLAPISGDIVTALIYGEAPPVNLAPFAVERFAA